MPVSCLFDLHTSPASTASTSAAAPHGQLKWVHRRPLVKRKCQLLVNITNFRRNIEGGHTVKQMDITPKPANSTRRFAKMLKLKPGSLPTVRDGAGATSSGSTQLPVSVDVACQTDPLDTRTAGTQLFRGTLRPHYRSAGLQTTATCKDFAVGTSTADTLKYSSLLKRPSKRPRLDPEEELKQEDDSYESGLSLAASKKLDSIYDPADSVHLLLSKESSTLTHNRKYIVQERCVLDLFGVCPVCKRECNVRILKLGTFVLVEQRCPDCDDTVKVYGNMKADSPGDPLKIGSVGMMDIHTKPVVDIQLIQVNG